jgi:aldehyde dehydrogenase (NAD+)
MEYGPAPESDKEALAWLAKRQGTLGHFIGGAWTKAGKTFEVINPATGKPLARVAHGTKDDVDAAVAAARKALPKWKAFPGHARARHLYALARAVQKHSRLLAVLESMDNGKSIRETRDIDVPLVGAPLLSPRGLGSAARHRVRRLRGDRRRGPDHSRGISRC